MYRELVKEGLRPAEIDNMTLAQLTLYYPPARSDPAEAFRDRREYYLERLRDMLRTLGREVPDDLAAWPDERLNKLWLEVRGKDGVRTC